MSADDPPQRGDVHVDAPVDRGVVGLSVTPSSEMPQVVELGAREDVARTGHHEPEEVEGDGLELATVALDLDRAEPAVEPEAGDLEGGGADPSEEARHGL